MSKNPIDPMSIALEQARLAEKNGEVPVGAVVVDTGNGEVISQAGNRVETDHDPSAHAEVVALRNAAQKLGSPRLNACDLYVTLEPCPMCAQAISFARIRRVFFAAYDPKGGGVDHGARIFQQSSCHHHPEVVGGIREQEASVMLRRFFQAKRD